MVQRTLAQINKERNYATVCYQRLTIKTIPYRERMKQLDKEAEILSKMSEKELASVERNKKTYKESDLKKQLTDPNTGKDLPQPTIISDESDDIRL